MRLPDLLAKYLGLSSMGLADVVDWSKQELTLYARAMDEYQRPWGPGFKSLLPGKTQGRVASLYYNAWKRRAIPEAQAWHQRQIQVGLSIHRQLQSNPSQIAGPDHASASIGLCWMSMSICHCPQMWSILVAIAMMLDSNNTAEITHLSSYRIQLLTLNGLITGESAAGGSRASSPTGS